MLLNVELHNHTEIKWSNAEKRENLSCSIQIKQLHFHIQIVK